MHNSSQVDDWLPHRWLGLSKALHSDSPAEAAEFWYQKQMKARTDFGILLDSLSLEEPTVNEGSLQFMPHLLLLPEHIQRNFLTFILHHRQDIQFPLLKRFTETLLAKVKSDSWPCVLLRILSCCVQQDISDDMTDRGFMPYTFTAENQTAVSSLCQKLKTETSAVCPLWNTQTNLGPTSTDIDGMHTSAKAVIDGTSDSMEFTVHSQSSDCIMLDQVEDREDNLSQTQMGTQKNQDRKNTDKNYQPLDDSVLEYVANLRDCWGNATAVETNPPETMIMLLSVTAQQMATVCQELGVSSFADSSVATASRHLCMVADSLSYVNCTVLLESLFLQKLLNLTEGASRLFMAAVMDVAETFPKQLIDVVLVPCTVYSRLGQPQVDVFCKVVTEVLGPENTAYLLRRMLDNVGAVSAVSAVSDHLLSLLQVIMGSKINLDDQMLQTYLSLLEKASNEKRNNKKYGKLVLITVQKYGKQMTPGHLSCVDNIVSCHETFLKKTIGVSVARLKK